MAGKRGKSKTKPAAIIAGQAEPGVDRQPYLLSQAQADQILKHRGLSKDLTARFDRHRMKWLPDSQASTTIPLSAEELASLPIKLQAASK